MVAAGGFLSVPADAVGFRGLISVYSCFGVTCRTATYFITQESLLILRLSSTVQGHIQQQCGAFKCCRKGLPQVAAMSLN